MRKPFIIIWLALLVALPATQKNAIAAEPSASDKSTICNTDEARKSAKLWDYDLVDAYEFGLKIQHYVEQEDLQSLFGLVKEELRSGPRKKYIQGKTFLEIFSEKWRETVLSKKPACIPIGWRGFMMGHGNIWYEKNDETHEWEIRSIHADQKIEHSKTPLIGGWSYKGKLLTSDCFSTIWLSGDNYQYYDEKYGGDKEVDFRDFISKPGKYIGGPIPIVPIVPRGDEFTSAKEWLLAPKLSSCQQYSPGVGNITKSGGWISKQYCPPFSPDQCLNYSYGLIRRISLDHCRLLAPNFPENCIDLGLVQVSKETGGSMGNDVQEGIYGIVENPVSGENYMVPLVNFNSLNEALNFIDQLADDDQERKRHYPAADTSSGSKSLTEEIIKFEDGLSPMSAEAVHSALKQKLLNSYSAYLDAHLPYGYPKFQPQIETELKSTEIDIGIGKQIPAVFVDLGLWGFCGSGGCETAGLIKEVGTWKEVFNFFGDCSYRLLGTGNNGLRDIVAENCKSNKRYKFHFNGEKYVEAKSSGCLPDDHVASFTGFLSRETYPGRPNYTSIEGGDEPETGYYLVLSNSVCVESYNYEAEKSYPIDGIEKLQLNVSSPQLRDEIRRLQNKKASVIVTGKPYIGMTGHYHAPHNAAISVDNVSAVN